MSNPINEPVYAGEFVLSEDDFGRSRDQVVIDQSQTLKAGTVLGKISVGTLSAAFSATGATGNPTSSAITVAAGTLVGEYDAVMTDATHFDLYAPAGEPGGTGELVAKGVLGSAFSAGGLGFTLTAGGTPCIASDVLRITVSAAVGSGRYVALAPSATDGSQIAAAVNFSPVTTASGATANALVISRAAQLKSAALDWGSATSPQIVIGSAQLQASGMILR